MRASIREDIARKAESLRRDTADAITAGVDVSKEKAESLLNIRLEFVVADIASLNEEQLDKLAAACLVEYDTRSTRNDK